MKMICKQENERVMLNSISWGQYFSTLALLLVCYYIVIGYRYYRWKILAVIGIRKVENSAVGSTALSNFKNSIVAENHGDYLPKPALEIDISPLVQSFTDEVQAYLKEAVKNKTQKEELLNSLQIIGSKYPALKDADCKNELIRFVSTEVNRQYPDLLQSNDVNLLWN